LSKSKKRQKDARASFASVEEESECDSSSSDSCPEPRSVIKRARHISGAIPIAQTAASRVQEMIDASMGKSLRRMEKSMDAKLNHLFDRFSQKKKKRAKQMSESESASEVEEEDHEEEEV
jgi:hypothetical protein